MISESLQELKESCEASLEAMAKELSRVRTGRASTSLLEGIRVSYYGSPTPLGQVATISVADARLLTVSPWEKSLLGDIEKAIMASGLGLTPSNDGKIIRIPIPALTGERRKELVKKVKGICEEYKVTMRGHRRDVNETLKMYKEDKEISEDEYHSGLKEVQKSLDKYVERVDALASEKEKEIMDF
ncbi:MAG: ribosome recycling factor [Myxococcota bacterium]